MLKTSISMFGQQFPNAVIYVSELHLIRSENKCSIVAKTYASQEAKDTNQQPLAIKDYPIDFPAYLARVMAGDDPYQALDELFKADKFPNAEII